MNIKIIFAFTLGVAAGTVATCKFFKTKYEAIAQEEIDSVKEVYYKKESILAKTLDSLTSKDEGQPDTNEEDVAEYTDMVKDLGYTKNEQKGGSEPMKEKMIEVIPPDEFGENDEYDLISLTYYANDILTDDGDDPIYNIDDVVGPDALDSFGEWDDNVVYVRNDGRKCYYEICKDLSEYSDPSVDA